jgi:hypothetical protein
MIGIVTVLEEAVLDEPDHGGQAATRPVARSRACRPGTVEAARRGGGRRRLRLRGRRSATICGCPS